MGVPGADVYYVLESLREIEAALCKEQDEGYGSSQGDGEGLKLLRILKEELEAIQ